MITFLSFFQRTVGRTRFGRPVNCADVTPPGAVVRRAATPGNTSGIRGRIGKDCHEVVIFALPVS